VALQECVCHAAVNLELSSCWMELTLVLGTRGQYLIWSEFLTAVRTNKAQAARALGAPIFDYYADHPDEAAIFRATMQSVSEGVASGIASMLDTSTYLVAVDVGGADGALVHSLMQHNPRLRGIVLDRDSRLGCGFLILMRDP